MNKLYFGDNLTILREHVADESVDLVYLDPPFNSQARYNVLFKSPRSDVASAQVAAFLDLWSWSEEAEVAFHDVMRSGSPCSSLMSALRQFLGESDMMAYLVMMTSRLLELRRVLRKNGTLFLHCDPAASHYLKIILDSIFGHDRFSNEIIWQRSTGKSLMSKRLPSNHDVILSFEASHNRTWNANELFDAYNIDDLPNTIARKYIHDDGDGRLYRLDNLINPNSDRPNLTYEYRGVTRVWRWRKERMMTADADGLIYQSGPGRVPQLKRYLNAQKGIPLGDVWTDIPPLNSQARERLGYPTQKPLKLLDRLIRAASNKGDVILDPFCGCGTTVHAAQALDRRWIGIDISVHAIHVIEKRLREAFGAERVPKATGIPADYETAARLASSDAFQFQWWANYLVGVHVLKEVKKGADRGIDGELFFPNGPGRPYGRMLTSVKAGKNIGPAMVREFRGVLEREEAEMGLFICLDEPTPAMEKEAVVAGFAPVVHGRVPRLQIVCMKEWFSGKRPHLPPVERLPYAAFSVPKASTKGRRTDPAAPELPFSFIGGKEQNGVVAHINPLMVSERPDDLLSGAG